MKKALLIILLLFFSEYTFSQDFHKSKTYKLSEFKNAAEKMQDGQTYASVFLKDSTHKKIKEFKVNLDTYSSEYSNVEEIATTNLINIKKIIKVRIAQCACYCNEDTYYWLITEQNKWIMLPKIEHYDYDIGNTYEEYIFSEDSTNSIKLIEFKEKLNLESPNKNTPSGFDVERTYQKIIKYLKWNGEKINSIN